MKRLIQLATRCYPLRWRERYGPGFQALLEDVGPGWRDLVDVLREGLQMRLTQWSWPRMAGVFAIGGALACGAISLSLPDRFASSTAIGVPPFEEPAHNGLAPRGKSAEFLLSFGAAHRGLCASKQSPQVKADELGRTLQRVLSRKSLADVIERDRIYEQMRAKKPLEDVIEKMRRDIRVGGKPGNPDAFILQFDYEDPAKAQLVTRDLANRIVGEYAGASLIDAPNLPATPAGPNRVAIALWGLAGGAVLGAVFARFRRRLPQPALPA